MSSKTITIDAPTARRLAITAQRLHQQPTSPTKADLLDLMRTIRCLQLDPIRAVERTQYLVLWSRLGHYNRDWLAELMAEQHLFEYWAHAASIVLTEDFHLHELMMRRYANRPSSAWGRRVQQWVADNSEFKQYILDEFKAKGPLLTNEIDDQSKVPWESGGWSSGRSVAYMLDYLWTTGEIMVARRDGLKRWWDLSHRVLPLDTLESGWDKEQVTRDAAQKALKALGVGRLQDIKRHFTEGRYYDLPQVLEQLTAEGALIPVEISGVDWPGDWLMHVDQLPLLDQLAIGRWQGQTTLLSPFDNLIRDRDRTELMWDFYYRIEIYVPKAKREFGYYVLPILHGERLIGRIDPKMDYKKKVLTVHNVYAEDHASGDPETAAAISRAIGDLGHFLGAKQVVYDSIPDRWRSALQSHPLPAPAG